MPYKPRFGGAFFFDSKGRVSSPPFPVKVRWRPASGPPVTAKWGPEFGSCRRRYSARSRGTCRTVRGQRPGGRARTRRGSFQLTRPVRVQCGSACPLCGGNSARQQAEIGQSRLAWWLLWVPEQLGDVLARLVGNGAGARIALANGWFRFRIARVIGPLSTSGSMAQKALGVPALGAFAFADC